MSRQYGIRDIWSAKDVPVGERHQQTRRIGSALNRILDHLVRIDASEAELARYAEVFEKLETDLARHGRVDQMKLYERFVSGTGTAEDVLNVVDYDIYTGCSTGITLPLELWIEDNEVRGRACAGMQYQGPPGRVHGGIIAGIFDVALAKTQELAGVGGFTGTLKIKYLKATPIREEFALRCWVDRLEGRKLFNKGQILVNGEVTAEADGIWISAFDQIFSAAQTQAEKSV